MKYKAISNPVISTAKKILFNMSFLNTGSADKKSFSNTPIDAVWTDFIILV